jgi:hypothetical protein
MHDASSAAAKSVTIGEPEPDARTPDARTTERANRRARAGLRAALIFGVVAATIEMAIVLWMAFC